MILPNTQRINVLSLCQTDDPDNLMIFDRFPVLAWHWDDDTTQMHTFGAIPLTYAPLPTDEWVIEDLTQSQPLYLWQNDVYETLKQVETAVCEYWAQAQAQARRA